MRTIVYVDGLNLYYGCLKNTPWKWLDLASLSKGALHPEHGIVAARYFRVQAWTERWSANSEQGHRAFCACTAKPVHRPLSRNCREILSGEKNLLTFCIAIYRQKLIHPCGFRLQGTGPPSGGPVVFWADSNAHNRPCGRIQPLLRLPEEHTVEMARLGITVQGRAAAET